MCVITKCVFGDMFYNIHKVMQIKDSIYTTAPFYCCRVIYGAIYHLYIAFLWDKVKKMSCTNNWIFHRHSLSSVFHFYHENGSWFLSNAFSTSSEMMMSFFTFHYVDMMYFIKWFSYIIQPCTPGIYVVRFSLLVFCWRISASVFIKILTICSFLEIFL